jgi:murein DD-endopeptidase MepM/ murein hydrolase activator NlpD
MPSIFETKIKRQLLALSLTAAMVLTVAGIFTYSQIFSASAQTVDTLKNQQSDLQARLQTIRQQINSFQQQITATQKQANTLKNQISIFDKQISLLSLQIEANQTQVDDTNLQIEEIEEQIDRRKAEIEDNKKILGQLIVQLNEMDTNSLLYMGLGNDNFSAFLDQVQYTQSVQGKVFQIVQNIKAVKAKLEEQEIQLKEQLKQLKELREQLDHNQQALNGERAQRQGLLNQTKGVERNYQTLLAKSKGEEDKIEKEMNDLDNAIRAKLGNLAPPQGTGALGYPMAGTLTQGYGNTGFTSLGYNFHNGIDLAAPPNTPIYAAADGNVVACDTGEAAYGNWCAIKHTLAGGRQIVTLYAHMTSFKLRGGQTVKRGDLVGYEGNTGNTTRLLYGPHRGFHLHFTVFDAQGFGISAGAYTSIYGHYSVPYGYTYNPMNFLSR